MTDGGRDHMVVGTEELRFAVTPATAGRLGRFLGALWPPRWLRFVDHHGARVWVRTELVEYVEERTALQRARRRALRAALRREARRDRRWDEG